MLDFEKLKMLERFSRVNGPLIKLLHERWATFDLDDETYKDTVGRVQKIGQELLDLLIAGLL